MDGDNRQVWCLLSVGFLLPQLLEHRGIEIVASSAHQVVPVLSCHLFVLHFIILKKTSTHVMLLRHLNKCSRSNLLIALL